MDEQLFGITMLGRPLFTSLFVGLILGDVQQGVIVGAALESMFMGAIMVGAAVPPEVYASGVLGCAFAIITGTGTAAAVALALPVSVFLQVWRNFCYAVPGAFACKRIEAALEARDLKKANLLHLTIVPLSIGIPSALLVFCSLFFGADLINNALNAAHAINSPVPLTGELMEMMQSLKAYGHEKEDHSALARYYEKISEVSIVKK